MAWYWIVLIVLAALIFVLFNVYMFNLDMKLVAFLYKKLNKFHDKKEANQKLSF